MQLGSIAHKMIVSVWISGFGDDAVGDDAVGDDAVGDDAVGK